MTEPKQKVKKVIPTLTYARVVGYYRSVDTWNDGKQKEWSTRKLCCLQ